MDNILTQIKSINNLTTFIGCGNMGTAMLKGWQNSGYDMTAFSALVTSTQSQARLQSLLADRVKINQAAEQLILNATAGTVILGFKPQQLSVLGPMLANLPADVLVLSMLASTSLQKLEKYFPKHQIVRCMPALSVQHNISSTPICSNDLAPDNKALIEAMFTSLGGFYWAKEDIMPLLTLVNGSIPAIYLEYSLQIAKVASELGLDFAQAKQFTASGLISAARLIEEIPDDESTESIIDAISSKGGITLAYNNATRDKIHQLAKIGVQASLNRSQEIEQQQ